MSIIPEFSGPTLKESAELENLLKLVNNKLAVTGQLTWENISFGLEHNIKPCIDDLLVYRYIITQKLNGCGCYENTSLKFLISKIKQLTL